MKFGDELEILRAALAPDGTAKVVGLRFEYGANYFEPQFLTRCIAEYERRALQSFWTGDKLTPLEQLAVCLLRDSAGLPAEEAARG